MACNLMRRFALLFVALAGLCSSPAFAQATYPTPAGSRVNGVVNLVCDSAGANCAPAGTAGAGADKVQGDTASGVADAGNPVKIGARFNTTAPTVANGQRVDLQASNRGELLAKISDGDARSSLALMNADGVSPLSYYALATLGYNYVFDGTNWNRSRGDTNGAYVVEAPSAAASTGTTPAATAAVANNLVAKASAGNLYGYNVVSGASAGYVMIFNATAAPADGAVTPLRCIPLAANTGVDVNMRGPPIYFSTGITLVFSTTGCFNKTASATAFIAADVK